MPDSTKTRVVPVFSSSSEVPLADDDPLLVEMTGLSEQLMQGTPKLDVVFKNLISLCVARSQVVADDTLSVENSLAIVRVVLKKLQAQSLPEAAQWGTLHTQADNQTADARILQLMRYKVARLLHNRTVERGAKVYKVFGVQYLLWTQCWDAVRAASIADRPAAIQEDTFANFLDTFESALRLMDDDEVTRMEHQDAQDDDEEEALEAMNEVAQLKVAHNCDLIFSSDFQRALDARKTARRQSKLLPPPPSVAATDDDGKQQLLS